MSLSLILAYINRRYSEGETDVFNSLLTDNECRGRRPQIIFCILDTDVADTGVKNVVCCQPLAKLWLREGNKKPS